MSLSQMQVFNKYIMPATIETLGQMINRFNQASAGAIRLTTAGFTGDFLQESFFAAIHSARRRVDRYAAQGAASATDLTQLKRSAVKIAGGFGPIRYEPSQMTWLNKPTVEGVEVASRNFAEALLQEPSALAPAERRSLTESIRDEGARLHGAEETLRAARRHAEQKVLPRARPRHADRRLEESRADAGAGARRSDADLPGDVACSLTGASVRREIRQRDLVGLARVVAPDLAVDLTHRDARGRERARAR